MEILFRGAESIIYIKDDILFKERLSKKYRIEELDTKIIKQRTKKEVNILKKLNTLGVPAPLFKHCDGNVIQMEYIKGKTIKEIVDTFNIGDSHVSIGDSHVSIGDSHVNIGDSHVSIEDPYVNIKDLFFNIGSLVNILHTNNIIHGDLTTSNFLYKDKVFIIDFGLSYISTKAEDKAVDLFVFEKSIKCAHDEKYLSEFYKGYISGGNSEEIMTRLELVRKRGRKHETE